MERIPILNPCDSSRKLVSEWSVSINLGPGAQLRPTLPPNGMFDIRRTDGATAINTSRRDPLSSPRLRVLREEGSPLGERLPN
jgi:hypothetical protein